MHLPVLPLSYWPCSQGRSYVQRIFPGLVFLDPDLSASLFWLPLGLHGLFCGTAHSVFSFPCKSQHLGHVKIGPYLSEASPSSSLTQTSCSSANDLLPWSGSLLKPSFIPYSPCSFFFFSFIFISWRLITLQYCSGFCHTLT